MSDITNKYKKRYRILQALSIIVTALPLIAYVIYGFIQGTVGQKATLTLTLIVCIILVVINFVFKYHIRSTIWLLLIGIHLCVNNIETLLILVALTTMLDEFVLAPLAKKSREKYVINNEIDKRE